MLRAAAVRSDEHAVTTGLAHGLHDIFLQVSANVVALGGVRHQKSLDVIHNGILVEIVADDFRDIRIDGFVVGHSGAERVGEHYVPGAIGVEETGHSQGRVGAEG